MQRWYSHAMLGIFLYFRPAIARLTNNDYINKHNSGATCIRQLICTCTYGKHGYFIVIETADDHILFTRSLLITLVRAVCSAELKLLKAVCCFFLYLQPRCLRTLVRIIIKKVIKCTYHKVINSFASSTQVQHKNAISSQSKSHFRSNLKITNCKQWVGVSDWALISIYLAMQFGGRKSNGERGK